MQCWAKPPREGRGEKKTATLPMSGCVYRPPGFTSAPGRPLLPGGPGFPQSPWKRERPLELTRPLLDSPTPQLTPHQRGPATCATSHQRLSDALKLIDIQVKA